MKIKRGQTWQSATFGSFSSCNERGERSPLGHWWHRRSLRVRVMAYFDGFVVFRSQRCGPCILPRYGFIRSFIPWRHANGAWTDNANEATFSVSEAGARKLRRLLKAQVRRVDSSTKEK